MANPLFQTFLGVLQRELNEETTGVFVGFFPDLPFLGVYVKSEENHPKHQGLFKPSEPRKPLENQRKTTKNTQNTKDFPWSEKPKENHNTKERTVRVCCYRKKQGIRLRRKIASPTVSAENIAQWIHPAVTDVILLLGVVSPHLAGEIFRAILVVFCRFFPRSQSALVNFSRFFSRFPVSYSQFESASVSLSRF